MTTFDGVNNERHGCPSTPPSTGGDTGGSGSPPKPYRKSKGGRSGRSWTPAEKAEIARMRAERISHDIIGAKFNVSSQRISQLALAWGLPIIGHQNGTRGGGFKSKQSVHKPENDPSNKGNAKVRKCLMDTSHSFLSHHDGERVCPRCRDSEAWRNPGLI